MGKKKPVLSEARERQLRLLLDEIGTGGISDVDELEEQDIELLRAYFGNDEDLQALLDRLRGGDESQAP